MIQKITPFLLLGIVVAVIIHLSSYVAYREHLLYDVSVYYQRSLYFYDHAKLTDVTNEYLPVASLYFILFSPIFFFGSSLELFEKAFIAGNCLLLFMMGWLIYKEKGKKALYPFSGLILAAGPIVLYRFELLVILTMILAILRFQKEDWLTSSIFLSLGTLVKLYPLLLLPYFLILTFHKKGLKQAVYYLAVFVLTTLGCTLLYFLLTQTGIKELLFSLDFHKDKPLGQESVLGGLTHLYWYFQNGQAAPIVARHNTWGVDDSFLLLPMPVLTYLWTIPVTGTYLWLLFSKQQKANFLFVITFLTSFFVFSKLFTPQYWLWVLFLLPFLKARKTVLAWVMILLAVLVTAITQFIYPLHYFDFLGYFYNQDKRFEYLFWIYLTEIFLMITTAIISVYLVLRKKE